MSNATPAPQPPAVQPFATWNPTCGIWETMQLDLSGRLAPYSETWPTSGMTRGGSAYPLPLSAHHISDSASSFSPIPLFRTPVAADSQRGSETLQQVQERRGTIWLSHQIIDLVLRGERRPSPDQTVALIEEFFDAMPQPLPAGNASPGAPPQLPRS